MQRKRGGLDDKLRYRSIELAKDFAEVRVGERSIPLAPEEHRILEALLQEAGSVITKSALMLAVGDSIAPERRAELDAHVRSLSSRLDGSGVTIITVPGIGYFLE